MGMEKKGILTEYTWRDSTLWLLRLQDLTEEDYAEMYACIGSMRQEKADGIKVPWKKRQSIGAGYLLYLLKKQFSIEEDPTISPGGKPAFPENKELFFNLSHSGTYAGLAFGKRELGLDLESIKRADLRMAKRFFREEEYEYLVNLEEHRRAEAFCRLWTGKEAVLKAAGKGLAVSLDSFSVLGDTESFWGKKCSFAETVVSWGEDRYQLRQQKLTEGEALLWVSVAILHE